MKLRIGLNIIDGILDSVLKRFQDFGFCLYCWLILCTLVNKQVEGIILSDYSLQTVANDAT